MRTPRDTDFVVQVEGLGKFVFGEETFRDGLEVRRLFRELVGPVANDEDMDLNIGAHIIAVLQVRCVSAPDGWDKPLEKKGVLNQGAYDTLMTIKKNLDEVENSFRGTRIGACKESGPQHGDHVPVLVPPKVQPSA